MPKVTFVNEHRTVEVEAGRTIKQIAGELGIAVCREAFIGTGIGDYTVWVKGAEGALSPPGLLERLMGAKGWKRFANRAQVLGDVEIFTQAGIGERLRAPRPIGAPPNPSKDANAKRKPVDASGSAAFPYGSPLAVGQGKREAIARSTGKAGAAKGGKAAAAAAEESEEGDE